MNKKTDGGLIPLDTNISPERWKLLIKWVAECLCTNPEVISESKTNLEVYNKLYELWVDDCQKALKSVILQARG